MEMNTEPEVVIEDLTEEQRLLMYFEETVNFRLQWILDNDPNTPQNRQDYYNIKKMYSFIMMRQQLVDVAVNVAQGINLLANARFG